MGERAALVHGGDAARTEALARRLTADGFRVSVVDADRPEDPATAVARAVAGGHSLDVLVCAVDQPAPGPFLGRDPQEWYADVLSCLTPPFRLVRAAAPALRRSGAGRVVLLGAGWTTTSRPDSTGASAVHGAVVALTKTLARDLGPDAVTVNEVVSDPDDPPTPEAVAAAVSYLCGPAAGAVVGQLVTLGSGGPLRP
jgi:NAD(P)-dependent dehydrogenase (short-subunit alcohol dehydrogenase family)